MELSAGVIRLITLFGCLIGLVGGYCMAEAMPELSALGMLGLFVAFTAALMMVGEDIEAIQALAPLIVCGIGFTVGMVGRLKK